MNPRLIACVAALQLLGVVPIAAQSEPVERMLRRPITIRTDPGADEPVRALIRARAASQAEQHELAFSEYRRVLEIAAADAPQRGEALRGFSESGVKLAEELRAQGRIAEARKILQEVLRRRPSYTPAIQLLGELGDERDRRKKRSARGLVADDSEVEEPIGSGAELPRETAPSPPPKRNGPPRGGSPPEVVYRPTPIIEGTPTPAATVRVRQPLVKVYFATDRLPSGAKGPSKFFGPDRNEQGDQLTTGVLTVSVPPVHKEGRVERPLKFFIWERKENPKKHFVLTELKVTNGEAFYESLRRENQQRAPEQRSVFVFIHGFNVSFDEAAFRTAQLAYDLDFEGVPILYSWPSRGGIQNYPADQSTATYFSPPNLQRFLERVAAESGAERIHLAAHSMGNVVLMNALQQIARTRDDDEQTLFDNIIMAAPDVPSYWFKTQVWEQVQPLARRFTLYASSSDQALLASMKLSRFDRLGEGGPKLTVLSGLDTIDATGIDTALLGHSYVNSCKPILDDLQLLMEKGFEPFRRKLRDRQKEGLAYWVFP